MGVRAAYELPAPAKLNLFLHVVGRRPDGYHLLQSLFVFIDWADTLHVERRGDGRVQRHDLGASLPADDLCLRAARLLQAASGTTLGADIHIDKRLPAGAGLGGGSSDAATTLLALNRVWGLGWPRARLLALAARLGADVPFFVGGDNAFVEGVGDRLQAVPWPAQWYAVLKPRASLATADIFGDPALPRDTRPVILPRCFEDADRVAAWSTWVWEQGRNDLQGPAESQCTEVAEAARWLEARFGHSRMTGSGSAVFAKAGAGDGPVATFPAQDLAPGWEFRLCRGLTQHPLRGWAD
jgi:4-diphosphocytidyl-2-C-methyl-D-erythritol kinase